MSVTPFDPSYPKTPSYTQTSWFYVRRLPSMLTKTCRQGRVPGCVVTYCFRWKSKRFLSAKPEIESILTIAAMENIFDVKCLESGERSMEVG